MNYVFFDFRKFWEDNFKDIHKDITHLFSGKPIVNGVAGSADSGGVCRNPLYSYAATKRKVFSFMWRIFAHEIGHNLNATHVEGAGDCRLSIMYGSMTSIAERFCQTSINQITNFVNSYGRFAGN